MKTLDKIKDLQEQLDKTRKAAKQEYKEKYKEAWDYIKSNGFIKDEYEELYHKQINDGYVISVVPPVFDEYGNDNCNYYYIGVSATQYDECIVYENSCKIKSFNVFVKTIEAQIDKWKDKWKEELYTFKFQERCNTVEEFINSLRNFVAGYDDGILSNTTKSK